jgi:hypothetical protein
MHGCSPALTAHPRVRPRIIASETLASITAWYEGPTPLPGGDAAMAVLDGPIDSCVRPREVWGELAPQHRARVISFLATLATDLITATTDPNRREVSPCPRRSLPPRSNPTTVTARP